MPTCFRHRKVPVVLLLFITVLSLVTVLLHVLPAQSPRKQAIWLRYVATTQPQLETKPCSSCSQAPEKSVTVVAVRSTEDTSWLDVYLGRIRHLVYQIIDANAEHTTTVNKGNEAMPYLQYIVDHYEDLPDISVFSHGAMCVPATAECRKIGCQTLAHSQLYVCRSSWHLVDKVRIIRSLQWGRHGFANLRHARMVCPEVWNCHHLGLDWRWSGNWLHPTDWRNITRLRVSDVHKKGYNAL